MVLQEQMRQQLVQQQERMRQQRVQEQQRVLVRVLVQVLLLFYRKQRGQRQRSKLPKRVICS